MKLAKIAVAVLVSNLVPALAQSQQQGQNYPLSTPPGSNPSAYGVPTMHGGQPGAQVGGSYTTQGGTTFSGTASTTQGGGNSGQVTVTIPCGKACGN